MARRRRGSLFSPAAFIRRASISRGLLGDDRFWRTIFLLMMGRRVMRRVLGAEPEVVALERLEPGQFVRIDAIDPRTLETGKKRRKR